MLCEMVSKSDVYIILIFDKDRQDLMMKTLGPRATYLGLHFDHLATGQFEFCS